MPVREEPYILALSGANYSSETKYAVRVNASPTDDGSSLTSATVNEPNNDETQATVAYPYADYRGYLGVYDLDFYRVHFYAEDGMVVPSTNTRPESEAFVWSRLPEFRWDPIENADRYHLEIGNNESMVNASSYEVTEPSYTKSSTTIS